jgi:hypothetical protein
MVVRLGCVLAYSGMAGFLSADYLHGCRKSRRISLAHNCSDMAVCRLPAFIGTSQCRSKGPQPRYRVAGESLTVLDWTGIGIANRFQ